MEYYGFPEYNELAPSAKRILDVSTKMFLQRGFASVTTRDISAAAGLNISLIQYYFSSKNNLGLMVRRALMTKVADAIIHANIDLPSAEMLFIYNYVTNSFWESTPERRRFVDELQSFGDMYDNYTGVSDVITRNILSDYNLLVSENDLRIYRIAMNGTAMMLRKRMHSCSISLNLTRMVSIFVSHFFYDIGLSTAEITRIEQNCIQYIAKNEDKLTHLIANCHFEEPST